MSGFKIGDWVVRFIFIDAGSISVCKTGRPVQIVYIEDEDDDCWLIFGKEDGGNGWECNYFREATPEDFKKWGMKVPSEYKTQRTLEDVKSELDNKLEEVERLKKELEEIENPTISVSIPKNKIEDFVMYWNDRISFGTPTHYICNILKEALEQHNAKVSQ